MIVRLILVLSLLGPSLVIADAQKIEEARGLLKSGQADSAYQLLSSIAADIDGAEFDYLLGIAALDSGRAGIALFAFERVLAQQPNHIYARAELGRAFFRLGEYEEATEQFEQVRTLNPPNEIASKLDLYEAALTEESGPGYRMGAYLEGMIGYDSNYSSATNDQSVSIPAFGNLVFNLDELFTEDDSLALGARAGGYLITPFNKKTSLIANLTIEGTDYPTSNNGFFFVNLRGNAGVQHRPNERNTLSVQMSGFSTWVSDFNYVHSLGVTGTWQHKLTKNDHLSAFVRIADLNYADVIDFRDATQYLGGVTLSHFEGGRWGIGVGVFGGAEIEANKNRRDIGRELYGGRGFGHYKLTPKLTARAEISGQFSDFRGTDSLFLTARDDEQIRGSVALNYAINKLWSVRPEFRYTNNSSNFRINDYERFETLVFVRREFN